MAKLTRRQFIGAAGGVTFLALAPVGRGLFALTGNNTSNVPFFTAVPYIQPGSGSKLIPGAESLVVAWQTEAREANFVVEFGPDQKYKRKARVNRAQRFTGDGADSRLNYSAQLTGLKLGAKYFYRVTCNGEVVLEGFATTRQPRGTKIRFASFGDNSCGNKADHIIAYLVHEYRPDFVMNVGDNVYDGGRDQDYAQNFFPVYNADKASPETGGPLLRSVPYYTVLANHDVRDRDDKGRSVGDFNRTPGALAYYTNMHLPLNGPVSTNPTPLVGDPAKVDVFKNCAGARYPNMANYSYDYGDAHFTCLDSNIYIDPTDPALVSWIEKDLKSTDARWKFVAYHHPSFDVGGGHYDEQHMRALAPLFERCGVDFVLSGHEHIYQRCMPMRFTPTDLKGAKNQHSLQRRTPGKFEIDRAFDGVTNTRPNGVIYIITGAGGNTLYNPSFTNNPPAWLHPEDNNVAYVSKFVSDRYSFSFFEIDGNTLNMKQVDNRGDVIDTIRVTKT